MAYQENKPLATDRLKDSQADLQGNFQSNKAAFDQNHVTFDDADAGKHKFLQMPEQAAAPLPTTAVNEMALYTREEGGAAQMFIRREDDGDEINLTNNATQATAGSITFPSGLIMKWGETTGADLPGNSWKEITFPVAFPNECFSIQVSGKVVTPQPSDAQTTTLIILNTTWTKTSFYVFNRATGAAAFGIPSDCTWFAIGN